jgi:hypothetical protein
VELWRRAANPWGQEVLIGISWDLMWAAVFAGLAFTLAHAVWAKWLAPAASTDASGGSSVAGRVIRVDIGFAPASQETVPGVSRLAVARFSSP